MEPHMSSPSPCLKSKNWTNVGSKLWFFEQVVRKTDKAAISALFLFQIPRVSRSLHTHTHTHEMSYMRGFKDIATAGTGLVDAEAVQPEYHAFLAQQEFIRAKGGLDLHGVLANVCRPVMETVQFCHLENLEKIGRKSGENMEATCGTF